MRICLAMPAVEVYRSTPSGTRCVKSICFTADESERKSATSVNGGYIEMGIAGYILPYPSSSSTC